MRIIYALLTLFFFSCIVVVAVLNPEHVTVRLWADAPGYTFPDTPVAAVIFISAAAGAIFACIIAVLEGSRIRLANVRLRAQIRKLQQEIETMRRPSLDPSNERPLAPFPPAPEASVDEEVGAV